MGVYLRGNFWYMDFRIDGKRYTESIGRDGPVNRTVAKEKYTIRAREVIQGVYKPKAIQTPFDKFKEQYLEWSRANKKPKSSKRDESSLKQLSKLFDGKNLSEINPMMIERYKLNRKGEEVAPATINRELACLRNMLNMATTWKKSSKRSWDFGKYKEVKLFKEPPERMRPLTEEEEVRLFAEIRSTLKARHLEPIVLMALHTGMRKGEIFNLKWTNVNLNNGYITVEKTKNNKNRNIPINNL
jgi:integrase